MLYFQWSAYNHGVAGHHVELTASFVKENLEHQIFVLLDLYIISKIATWGTPGQAILAAI